VVLDAWAENGTATIRNIGTSRITTNFRFNRDLCVGRYLSLEAWKGLDN
jgi:hypothetical protein